MSSRWATELKGDFDESYLTKQSCVCAWWVAVRSAGSNRFPKSLTFFCFFGGNLSSKIDCLYVIKYLRGNRLFFLSNPFSLTWHADVISQIVATVYGCFVERKAKEALSLSTCMPGICLSMTSLCATSCWWYLQLSAEDVFGPGLAGPQRRWAWSHSPLGHSEGKGSLHLRHRLCGNTKSQRRGAQNDT